MTQTSSSEPLLNIPPLTLALALGLLAVFLAMHFLPAETAPLIEKAVFIPANFSAANAYTLVTYGLLHFGFGHIAMNGFGLVAFGSAIERIAGKFYYLLIFLGGVIVGAVGHWLIFPDSAVPLGGASAGVSALFGAVLPYLVRKHQMLSTNVIFLLTNIALGMMGVPGSDPTQTETMSIAWQAHIFGFAYGEIVGIILLRKKISRLKKRDIDKLRTTEV